MKEYKYFDKAKEYLLSFEEISPEILGKQLNGWSNNKPKTIVGLYKAMLMNAQNRQGMPNSIGDINNLKDILFGFNPRKVIKNYSSWDEIFDAIKNSSYKPPGRMVKSNNKSYWVIYCKSILSIAEFLHGYKNVKAFNEFVEGFYTNEYSKVALPLLLKQEIYGFGFALACDFLKENGYPEFIKPDTHINFIARELGITESASDYGIFKDVVSYCERIDKLPYEVDKLFWLVGSGRFYLSDIKIKSSRNEFIKIINKELK